MPASLSVRHRFIISLGPLASVFFRRFPWRQYQLRCCVYHNTFGREWQRQSGYKDLVTWQRSVARPGHCSDGSGGGYQVPLAHQARVANIGDATTVYTTHY
jgi:hypothetical protein